MDNVSRIAGSLLLLAASAARPAFSQGGGQPMPPDLSGEWRKITHEDVHERGGGPDPGEYWGIPINDAGRMRSDTYNGEWLNVSLELQCRPHPTGYQQLGPDLMRIEKEWDPITRQVYAYSVLYQRTPGVRMVYMDGRPHPSPYAAHSWEGFSTGKWEGDTLTITATHLKESFIRRNGVEGSFRRTVTEHVSLDEPYLTWILIVNDPDYLTEPLVRSVTWIRNANGQIPVYPCSPQLEEYRPDILTNYKVPNYLVGANPWLTEVAFKYKMPLEGVRGGAETIYPEYQPKVKALSPPPAQFTLKPTYSDVSTRVAELAAAQPARAPDYANAKVEALHVNGNVYMLAGAGANISLQVGGDGMMMVDSGAAQAFERVLAAIQQIAQQHPVVPVTAHPANSARPFASIWQVENSPAPAAVRMIINTSADPENVGANDSIARSSIFHPIGNEGQDQGSSEVIVAHEKVLARMEERKAPTRALPTTTFFANKYRLHRYVNGEGIEVIHVPNARTDGDSIVWFRGSNVISTGNVFNSDTYPAIEVDQGGSIQGVIDALVKIADMCYAEYMSQGGTMVIPGHGHISDVADVAYYRDMMAIIRDRIADMKNKRMTLEQVKAAKPTMDYDPLFGREPGSTAKLVEAVYRTVGEKAKGTR